MLLAFACGSAKEPGLALVPLIGLHPGSIVGRPNDQPTLLWAWAVGDTLVFLTLAFIGIFRQSKPATAAFPVFFILSTLVCGLRYVRVINALSCHG
jgi:hypothetical protein